MFRIDPTQYQLDTLEAGETRRVDHLDCSAGADTRARLYLTRPLSSPTHVIGYCHNCQESMALLTSDTYEPYRDNLHGSTHCGNKSVEDLVIPSGLISDYAKWSTAGQSWWYANLSTARQAYSGSGIAEDPNTGRIFIPRYGDMAVSNTITGYQLRNVGNDKGSKYYTVTGPEDLGYTIIRGKQLTTTAPTHQVIVEDYISALHITWAIPTSEVIVNYGTRVNLEALDRMGEHTAKKVVWLDNDSRHVIDQAETMASTLKLLHGGECEVVKNHADPKRHSTARIKRVLNG